MKTMNNFAAQQLTKMQMNNVKGGVAITCFWMDNGALKTILAVSYTLEGALNEAAAGVPNGVNASCHILN